MKSSRWTPAQAPHCVPAAGFSRICSAARTGPGRPGLGLAGRVQHALLIKFGIGAAVSSVRHPRCAVCYPGDTAPVSFLAVPRRLTGRDVVVTDRSVRLAGQIPASTLLKCCKLRIVLVHRVIGLPGCWVAVMFTHLFRVGGRLELAGCDYRAGPRSGCLSPR